MAAWHYTQDGNILGPYSEEDMIELIGKGSVTFVTKVWDGDPKSEEPEWTYAYETPLSAFFSADDIPTGELSIRPEPEPEEMPPVKATTEPVQIESRPPETAGNEKKSRNSLLLLLAFLPVIFIIGLIIGATCFYFIH